MRNLILALLLFDLLLALGVAACSPSQYGTIPSTSGASLSGGGG